MIDNVVNMIEGIKNKVDTEQLLASADPLGINIRFNIILNIFIKNIITMQ